MKKLVLCLLTFLISVSTYATHNRAGEITYTHIPATTPGGSKYTYRIRVTTYTKESSTSADKCSLTVNFGDGDSAIVPRINGTGLCSTGERLGESLGRDTKKNIYEVVHTYPGPKTYVITMEDPNRNGGICNIPVSVDQSFFLRTVLNINPFLPANSSPILLNPPIDDGCVNECFEHNPGAYDLEGDSLFYSLTNCYANGIQIPGYVLPPKMTSTSINGLTGDLVWCSPPEICQYNVAILIEEWKLYAGKRYYVGSVLRDMQIDIKKCNNNAPIIDPIPNFCIVADSNLIFNVTAHDIDSTDKLTLTATGGPLTTIPKATFTSTPLLNPVNGTFNWTPNCSKIQYLPYQVNFKVIDNYSNTPLANFQSTTIRVIAPAVTNLVATPSGASIIVKWDPPLCKDTVGVNRLKGYSIYRKNVCEPFIHSNCETGVPAYTGYTLIGTTNYVSNTFIDNNGGLGLVHGIDYSYIIVANYMDASESYASKNVCAHLVRDVPIITNVSVITTETQNGKIWIHWLKPLGLAPNLDTIANPPPYEYKLMQAQGIAGALTFNEIASYTYSTYSQLTDTGFVSENINTEANAYTYRVDFYSRNTLHGATHTASSIYLTTTPSDNKVALSWKEEVPWFNSLYYIYKENNTGSGNYTLIDSSKSQSYLDTNLVNGKQYCYKIISRGHYSDTLLPRPLYNTSQLKCEIPLDDTKPCQPDLTVTANCDIPKNILSWVNPISNCNDDAVKYNIYFAPTKQDSLLLLYSTTDINLHSYTHIYDYDGIPSVAGCYAITAVDSFANESLITVKKCVDNCPYYKLPNVFTPNGDNQNDFFTPLPGYRYIKDIDIKIYDRWGLLMFQTTDPNIKWNGLNMYNKRPCPSGTYYYVCTVNQILLEGITPLYFKGFIQLITENRKTTN